MWSIGILTYVLLSGHSPFGGDTKQETFCNITRGTLEFPPDLFDTISNNAKDFIRRLLVRNPSERMSAKECLSHPWLNDTEAGSPLSGIELTLIPTPGNTTTEYDMDSSTDSQETHFSPSNKDHNKSSCFSPAMDMKSNRSNGFHKSLSPKPNGNSTSDQEEQKTG
ncbi:Serine/threonine-protein kinase 17A, partial [Stegodyphus mimosarum]